MISGNERKIVVVQYGHPLWEKNPNQPYFPKIRETKESEIDKIRRKLSEYNNCYFVEHQKEETKKILDGLMVYNCEVTGFNKNIGSDVSFNIFRNIDKIINLYGSIDNFIKTLERFMPSEKIELKNNFINIWWDRSVIYFILNKIIKNGTIKYK